MCLVLIKYPDVSQTVTLQRFSHSDNLQSTLQRVNQGLDNEIYEFFYRKIYFSRVGKEYKNLFTFTFFLTWSSLNFISHASITPIFRMFIHFSCSGQRLTIIGNAIFWAFTPALPHTPFTMNLVV